MGNINLQCCHKKDRPLTKLTLLPSRKSTSDNDDIIRSPTFVSRADASIGSLSNKSELSSFDYLNDRKDEQLNALSHLKNELIPFFEIWQKLQKLNNIKYRSFCSLFYLNLSDDFITSNLEGFLNSSDPSKSGEFILKQINTTILKLNEIYSMIADPAKTAKNTSESLQMLERDQTFTSFNNGILSPVGSPLIKYQIDQTNKNEAIQLMEKFAEYYLIHLQLGIHETMFDESCNALEKSFDEFKDPQLGEFTLSARGGLQIFFEVTRALMMQLDLTEIQSILKDSGSREKDKIRGLIQNGKLVQKFIRFWDGCIMNVMNDIEKQLFSLRIYSHLIKHLQDQISGMYTPQKSESPVENTDKIVLFDALKSESYSFGELKSKSMNRSFNFSGSEIIPSAISRSSSLKPPESMKSMVSKARTSSPMIFEKNTSTDQIIMEQFHHNESFITTFSVGIISWINNCVTLLKQNEPKKLFAHLRNVKRSYKRMNIDINILMPLALAFKMSCMENENFYVKDTINRNIDYQDDVYVIDDEMEECIDYVIGLCLDELMPKPANNRDSTSLKLDVSFSFAAEVPHGVSSTLTHRKSSAYDLAHLSPRSMMNNSFMNFNINASTSDIFSADMNQTFDDNYLSFNSPQTSPKRKLHQNVYQSLIFWKSNVQIESITKQKVLSDKIFDIVSIKANDIQRELILDISSKIHGNVNIIGLLDKLFQKIELYSRMVPKKKHILQFLPNQSANAAVSTEKSAKIAVHESETDAVTMSNNDSESNPSKQMSLQQKVKLERNTEEESKRHSQIYQSLNERCMDTRLDFNSLQNDKDFRRLIEFVNEHEINPMIFKIFRAAIINILFKLYPTTFDNVTKRNFTLLLRTITSLIVT